MTDQEDKLMRAIYQEWHLKTHGKEAVIYGDGCFDDPIEHYAYPAFAAGYREGEETAIRYQHL